MTRSCRGGSMMPRWQWHMVMYRANMSNLDVLILKKTMNNIRLEKTKNN